MYSRKDIRSAARSARTNGTAWLGDPLSGANLEAVRVWYDETSKTYSIPGCDNIVSIPALGAAVEKALSQKGYPRHLTMVQDRASGRMGGAFGKRIESSRLTKKERRRLKKFRAA